MCVQRGDTHILSVPPTFPDSSQRGNELHVTVRSMFELQMHLKSVTQNMNHKPHFKPAIYENY